MKITKVITSFLLIMMLVACTGIKEEETLETVIIPSCTDTFTMTLGERIPVMSLSIPFSEVKGDQDNFINYCKPATLNPLYLSKSSIRTHQLIITFDAIYPIDSIVFEQRTDTKKINDLSVEVSLNDINFKRIINTTPLEDTQTNMSLGGQMAKSIKFIFAADESTRGIQDIKVTLADGMIIKEDLEWSNTFLRYNGWTGADGIFTFNLTDGNERIGAAKDTVGFIFSDTFIGEVYPHNNLRKSGTIINNSLGYMKTGLPFDESFSFEWLVTDNKPDSIFHPNAYIGHQARNLLDGDGLTVTQSSEARLTNSSDGISYLSDHKTPSIVIDLMETQTLANIYLWNYNANPTYGTKSFNLSFSNDNETFTPYHTYNLNQASGSNTEPYTLNIELEAVQARFIKIDILDSYDTAFVGLGKVMIFNDEQQFLFGNATSTHHAPGLHPNEHSARLWLQDGVVLNDHLYVFPILIKDFSNFFKVHNVGLMKIPLVDEAFDYANTEYLSSPLQVNTSDGGTIFFGAGLLNHVDIDGYIYIYGYKDLNGRHLVVGRFLPEDIENYNQWTYFDGESFTPDITKVSGLITGVSAELSVTYIDSGAYAGKYMLVVMENTTSGNISYALSDSPYGPFGAYQLIYQTTENTYLRDAFTYNAKLHPALSEPGSFLISYNVNTTTAGALSDARIYYPRFIRMIEVKK